MSARDNFPLVSASIDGSVEGRGHNGREFMVQGSWTSAFGLLRGPKMVLKSESVGMWSRISLQEVSARGRILP